jgi:predicted Zn finger-like uncharacterized protein
MVFHCPKCRAKYKIANHIITEKGINAKCHKCGNIFFVKKKEEMELANVISGIQENISRWEETAKPLETDNSVVRDEDSVDEFLNEIELDILKEKELPGEERLKELLTDESLVSDDKAAKEEPTEKIPDMTEESISSAISEEMVDKQSGEGEPSLNSEMKPDSFSSQDDMDRFLSDVMQLEPKEEGSNIPQTSEKGAEPTLEESVIAAPLPTDSPQPPPSEATDKIDIDLDKLLDDTAAELNIKLTEDAKKEAAEELSSPKPADEDAARVEEDIKLEEIFGSESEGKDKKEKETEILSADSGVLEGRRQDEVITDAEIKKDEMHEDMPDMEEDDLKPRGKGVGEKINEKWQNFRFSLSSYFSLLTKKTVIWKLAILSIGVIIIIGGVIGLAVIGGKKIISKTEEKKEVAVEAEKPQLKEPPVGEKKAEDGGKPAVVEEKSAEEAAPLQGHEDKAEESKPSPSLAENSVRLDAILPVAFSPDENKVMSINLRLELENKEGVDIIKGNLPYYEEIIEDSVDQFFRDKFYEDTHFVKEKLKEVILRKINENMKNGRVKKVDLEELKVK